MKYEYITENNLENKQKYNYSQYGGDEFLESYVKSRTDVINSIGISRGPHHTYTELMDCLEKISDKEDITAETKTILDAYVKTFEVRKRLYCGYDEFWKPLDEEYYDYNAYLLFSGILEMAYERTHNLKYLNCLMKINDTLISIHHSMPESCKCELKKVLSKEIALYNECANKAEE